MTEDLAVRSVMFRYDVFDQNTPHPRDWFRVMAPTAIDRFWVPQTLGDQIWIFYEFANADEMERFKAKLESPYKELVAEKPLTQWMVRR